MIFMLYPAGSKITFLLISQIYQDRLSLWEYSTLLGFTASIFLIVHQLSDDSRRVISSNSELDLITTPLFFVIEPYVSIGLISIAKDAGMS